MAGESDPMFPIATVLFGIALLFIVFGLPALLTKPECAPEWKCNGPMTTRAKECC